MKMLSGVTRGKIELPELIVLYGTEGVGKSTFAASAPKPIFLGTEKGTANLDVARLPSPQSVDDVKLALTELTNEAHDFATLAVDSLDWLEPIIHAQVCKEGGGVNHIDNAYGGYGKGYVAATNLWRQLTQMMADLREKKKMNIILLAHAEVKTFQDPQNNAGYDRYQMKLHKGASALVREFVDCVFFANYETYTKQDKQQKTRAYGEGSRLMHTERRPAFDAKNRFSLPAELPLSWEDYMLAKKTGKPAKPEALLGQINELLPQIKDAELKPKVEKAILDAGHDIAKLNVILNR